MPILVPVAAVLAVAWSLRGVVPVSIAAAAAGLFTCATYLAALLCLGFSGWSAPLRPAVALLVLELPCLAWLLGLWRLRQRRGSFRPAAAGGSPDRTWLAALAGPCVLVGCVFVAGRLHAFGDVAWAASGDARLSAFRARLLLRDGGITGQGLRTYPYFSNGLLALHLDVHGRGSGAPGRDLLHDLKSVAQLNVLALVAWSLAAAAVVRSLLPSSPARPVLVAAASALPLTGVALGVAARDGFVTVVIAMPMLLAHLLIALWVARTTPSGPTLTVSSLALACGVPVLGAAWSPLGVMAGAVCLATTWAIWRGRTRSERNILVACLVAGSAAGLAMVVPVFLSDTAPPVTVEGTIVPPPAALFLLVPVLVAGIARISTSEPTRWFLPYIGGTAAAAIVVLYAASQQRSGNEWNYFPAKVAWTWVLATLPLLLAVPLRRRRDGLLCAFAVLLLASAVVPLNSPLLPPGLTGWGAGVRTPGGTASMLDGWNQPDAATLAEVVSVGTGGGVRVALWEVADPGNDRLGNFWLALYDDPSDSVFLDWSYGATHSDVAELCQLLADDPGRRVLTRNAALPAIVEGRCGASPDVVEVMDPG